MAGIAIGLVLAGLAIWQRHPASTQPAATAIDAVTATARSSAPAGPPRGAARPPGQAPTAAAPAALAVGEIEAALARLGISPAEHAAAVRQTCGYEHANAFAPDPVPFEARRAATRQQLWSGLMQGAAREQALSLALRAQAIDLQADERAAAQRALADFALAHDDAWIVTTALRHACDADSPARCGELVLRRPRPTADAAAERWVDELAIAQRLGDRAGIEAAFAHVAAATVWHADSILPAAQLLASNAYAGLAPAQRIAVLSDWMLGPGQGVQRPLMAVVEQCHPAAMAIARRRAQCEAVAELMSSVGGDERTLRMARRLAGQLGWPAPRMAELANRIAAANQSLGALAMQAVTGPCSGTARLEQVLRDMDSRGPLQALELDRVRQAATAAAATPR